MIPKIIHYCWFGRKPLPRSAKKCIESWKHYFPDYKIQEWNEDNFNVNMIQYTAEAYSSKKYAFVSDFARIWILYNYGGIYFDTDVEVIKSMEQIIQNGAFMGCEINGGTGNIAVAPGLGIAVNANNQLYKTILDKYHNLNFRNDNGSINLYAIVRITTDILRQRGLRDKAEIQLIDGITIYPAEYFNPMDSLTGKLTITEHTYCIHHYMNSWNSPLSRIKTQIGKIIRRAIKLLK